MEDSKERKKGVLRWFASNHVAANLLMLLIISAGLLTIFTIKVEFFPEFALDMITVTVPYLGASPSDVEEGVVTRVEEAVAAVDGIKRLTSTSAEGTGMVVVEVEEYADSERARSLGARVADVCVVAVSVDQNPHAEEPRAQ